VALSFAIVAAEQAGVPANIDAGFTDEIKVLSSWNHELGTPTQIAASAPIPVIGAEIVVDNRPRDRCRFPLLVSLTRYS